MKFKRIKKKTLIIFLIILILLTISIAILKVCLTPESINYVALGDSLAQGYPYYLKKKSSSYSDNIFKQISISKQLNINVTYTNYGTSGFTSSDLLKQISKPDVAQNLSESNIITLDIGGNDLLKVLTTHGINDYRSILESVDNYYDNLIKILNILRTLNPNAKIYISNVFNPASPNSKTLDYEKAQYLTSYINKIIRNTSSPYNVKVIEIESIFLNHEYGTANSWFYDQIHPNEHGYIQMSKPFVRSIENDLKSRNFIEKIKAHFK